MTELSDALPCQAGWTLLFVFLATSQCGCWHFQNEVNFSVIFFLIEADFMGRILTLRVAWTDRTETLCPHLNILQPHHSNLGLHWLLLLCMPTGMCAWVAVTVPLHLMVPMATSALLAIAVPLAQLVRYRANLAVTILPLEQPSVYPAPKEPCVPPQPLRDPLPALLVRQKKTFWSQSNLFTFLAATVVQWWIYLIFIGHFCPAGTALPQPCPLGTFNNETGADSLSLCAACPSGVYCGSYGASAPQGDQTLRLFYPVILHT